MTIKVDGTSSGLGEMCVNGAAARRRGTTPTADCRKAWFQVALLGLALTTTGAFAQVPSAGGALYHFDDGTGSVVRDSSGAGNAGSIVGATFVPGKLGTALRFRGYPDRVVVPDRVVSGFGDTAYLEAWIRPSAYPVGGCGATIIRRYSDWRDWILSLCAGGTINTSLSNSVTGSWVTAGLVPLNVWTKVASYYDGAGMRLYVNDVEVGRHDSAFHPDWEFQPRAFEIGGMSYGPEFSFYGDIDEVAIGSKAATTGLPGDLCPATGLTCPGNVSASLGAGGCRQGAGGADRTTDLYTFRGQAGDRVQVDLASGEFPPRLVVFDPNGSQRSDDVGTEAVQRSFTVDTAGTYSLQVTTTNPQRQGAYRLTVSGCCDFGAPANPDGQSANATVKLLASTLAGQPVGPSNRGVSVSPGARLQGTVSVQTFSQFGSGAVVTLAYTPTWGDPATSGREVGRVQSPGTSSFNVPIDLVAPAVPGIYAIIFAFNGEYDAAHVLSLTNWTRGRAVWDDGNDVAIWSPLTIALANARGNVPVRILFDDPTGYTPFDLPATAVLVTVQGPSVDPPGIPILTAKPAAVRPGEPTTISWATVNSTSATLGPGFGNVETAGCVVVAPAATTTYTVNATGPGGARSSSVTVAVAGSCTPPAQAQMSGLPEGAVRAGSAFSARWTPVLDADPAGWYELSVSTSSDCASGAKTLQTKEPSAVVPTESGQALTYCLAVRAVSSGGCAGLSSAPARVATTIAPPAFVVDQGQSPRAIATAGSPPPTGSTVAFRNVGDSAADLDVSSNVGFVTVSPRSFAAVKPGQTVIVQLQFDPLSTLAPSVQAGEIRGRWQDGTGLKTVATSVVLTTLSSPPTATATGTRPQLVDRNEIHFIKPAGEVPPVQVVTVRNGGTSPIRIAPSIGPGGSWVVLSTGDFLTPIAPGSTKTFLLSVDRSRRASSDGVPPLSTYLTFSNVDGAAADVAVLAIFDEEPPAATNGTNRPSVAPGQTSFTLGSSVSATGSGALFISDGWIRNGAASPTTVDLYYTPDGLNGITSSGVLRSSVSLGAYSTYRLADFVRGLFSAEGSSGLVEIRSPGAADLSIRTTVDSITYRQDQGVVRYGAEIPVVRHREGTSATRASLHLPGISVGSGAGRRTNVILSETAGGDASCVIRFLGPDGAVLGETRRNVPPYSKVQINGRTEELLFPSSLPATTGSLEVSCPSGSGTVAAFATAIDDASQAYATKLGRFVLADAPVSVASLAAREAAVAAAAELPIVLPAVVQASGANDSYFTTRVSITNGTAREALLTLSFVEANRVAASRDVRIAPRGTVEWKNVLQGLFGAAAGETRVGMLFVGGAGVSQVTVSSETSTPVSRTAPERGASIASLAGYSLAAPELVSDPTNTAGSVVVSHPGLEESARFRTNLILAEVHGEPVRVRVRLVPATSGGVPIAEKTIDLRAYERLQLNQVMRSLVGGSGDGPLVDVSVSVSWLFGAGRVLALATKIDNEPASKRSDIYVLTPPGVNQGTIGF